MSLNRIRTGRQRALIAGCGDVGTELGQQLARNGYKVWGLRRSQGLLPNSIQTIHADLTNRDSLRALPEVDIAFFTASADGRSEDAYRNAYVLGLRNLVEALARQSNELSRLVFTSSTGVYGNDDGSWVDETVPPRPARVTGGVLLEAEHVVQNAPWPGTVVRLAGIYGPGRFGLVKRVHAGDKPLTGRYTNRIHVEDCGGILAHVAAMDDAQDLYVGVDDAPVTEVEVGTWLAERLKVRANMLTEQPTTLNKRCRNERIRSAGYEFSFPSYREGYPAIVDAFLAA